ncbi:hypothetical protein [Dietzia cinnamea]|uniref:hypothetical protein n=1 Tax=Dietzia cinnamea TaxID=321318 RepID=UPI00223BA307|nr:hypothetical protein [Dietzia cinnamea]MCT1639203.1 hypothetical protein [Dietzia cinnamea]MCT2076311.1 hypothetical protein [Dietzia cinnamea]MCT2173260.1 hypothetical protein [Dietzia cinnamea]MCT2220820.1 hypothetical protein [Dietzia cinnamea]
MRTKPGNVTPVVRTHPPHYRNEIVLELGNLHYEMTADEAHALADQLVDAAELSQETA